MWPNQRKNKKLYKKLFIVHQSSKRKNRVKKAKELDWISLNDIMCAYDDLRREKEMTGGLFNGIVSLTYQNLKKNRHFTDKKSKYLWHKVQASVYNSTCYNKIV